MKEDLDLLTFFILSTIPPTSQFAAPQDNTLSDYDAGDFYKSNLVEKSQSCESLPLISPRPETAPEPTDSFSLVFLMTI